MKRFLAIIAVAALAVVSVPQAASAAETDERHPDVQYAVEAVPGGIVLSERQVVWPALGMTLTAGSTVARAVGSCATGTYCAYSGGGMTGSKLTFTVCTNVSTAALRVIGSIANGRTTGKVRAKNSTGTVLGTAYANGSANVAPGTTSLLCML